MLLRVCVVSHNLCDMIVGSTKHTQRAKNVPSWLDGIIGKPEYIGSKETTAQVRLQVYLYCAYR